MTVMLAAALLSIAATEVRRVPAADAHQGAAANGRSLYAIANSAITRLDAATGRPLVRWQGDSAAFPHINSCTIRSRRLICAASNYPAVPMASRIETFDAGTLVHLSTRPLPGPGSLTWLDRHGGAWWACYANYDGKGGVPGRDHRRTMILRLDDGFRETGRWSLPDAVLDRMAPRSASGGAWGPDGLLYVTGHDRPELYALRLPRHADTFELVATVGTATGGQAFGWDRARVRAIWSIDRGAATLVESRVPGVER